MRRTAIVLRAGLALFLVVPLHANQQKLTTATPTAKADAKPLIAPVTLTNEFALPLPGPDGKTVAVFILKSCATEWPAREKYNRELCQEQQLVGASAIVDRDISSPAVRLIRRDCYEKNPTSYTMWDLCERQKLKASAEAPMSTSFEVREPTEAESIIIIRNKCAKDWPDVCVLVMPNLLRPVQSPTDVCLNVETFNNDAARFFDRAARLLHETTYWVYDPATESFGPS